MPEEPMPLSDEATVIETERLRLTPLRVEDADELVAVLGDERLHEFIGGRPATLVELRELYARLVAGSPDPNEVWRNWFVRRDTDSQALGTVQATLRIRNGRTTALVAWVIGVEWQSQGFGSEAARALVGRLRQEEVEDIVARVHPDHAASAAVAGPGRAATDGRARGWRARLARRPLGRGSSVLSSSR